MRRIRRSFVVCCLASVLMASGQLHAVEGKKLTTAEAKDLVRKAMEAEIAGNLAARDDLLTQARANESASLAYSQNGLLKLPRSPDWISIEAAAAKIADSNSMKRYESLRFSLVDTVEGNWKLAQACTAAKLPDQAKAHLNRVIELRPDHEMARAALGYTKVDGEWISPERREEDQQLAKAEAAAVEKHGRMIGEVLVMLKSSQQWERDRGMSRLMTLTDPGAVLAAEKLITPHSESLATAVVDYLSAIQNSTATQSLARHALLHDSPVVRSRAANALRSRDLHAYAPRLLSMLSLPIRSEIEAVVGPRGQVLGYRQVFERVGMDRTQVVSTKANLTPQAKLPADASLANKPKPRVARTQNEATEIARAALSPESQISQRQADMQNEVISTRNARILEILRTATGANLSDDPREWWSWYENQIGIEVAGRDYKETKEIRSQLTSSGSDLFVSADSVRRYLPPRRKECFVAGTLVTTHRGSVAIEGVQIGDMVLSKDIESGELSFRPVLQATVREPEELISIQAGEEQLRCTRGHLFWVSGRGWTKAGDLIRGMILHGAEKPLRIAEITEGGNERTYNLRIADSANYFVGKSRILSHDVSSRGPSEMLIPGYKAPQTRRGRGMMGLSGISGPSFGGFSGMGMVGATP
jgi:Pretoxin HINT domain